MKKVIVHIDRLRVPGVVGADALVDALRSQLGREFASAERVDAVVQGGDRDRVRVRPVRVSTSSAAEATGRSVANAIAGHLANTGGKP